MSVDERAGVTGRHDRTSTDLTDPKVNIRLVLAFLWVAHFLLWTFGDMLTLLQEIEEPITDSLILFVAPTTAVVQASMVVVCLAARPVVARITNLIVAPIYVLFDIGFFVDATEGWEYYLGVFYLALSFLIIWRAYRWPREA
jgi:hypothetical protein